MISGYIFTYTASRQPDEDTEISTQVAAPPKALVNKVQTIRELHSAQKFSLPSSKVHQ